MYIKRTFILSGVDDQNKKIICYVEYNQKETSATFKVGEDISNCFCVFNYKYSPLESFVLKAENNEFVATLPDYFDCNFEVCVALVDVNSKLPLYVGGTGDKSWFYGELIHNLSYLYDKVKISFEGKREEEKKENLFCEPTDTEIKDVITDDLLCECLNKKLSCENCKYRKAFFENNMQKIETINCQTQCDNQVINVFNKQSLEQPERVDNLVENDVNPKVDLDFYYQIKPSLDEIFSVYPVDSILENCIEGSKFAKVDYEKTGDYYSVGLIYIDNSPKYICYAIPCKLGSPPPENMDGFSQYLPLENDLAYYLMYQNASDGENVMFDNFV